MGIEVDSLELMVEADAKKANSSLDKLVTKLQNVSKALNMTNGASLENFSNGINSLSKSMQSMQSVKATDFNRLAKGIEKIASVNNSNLGATASALNNMAPALQSLSNVNVNNKSITSLVSAIARLSSTNVSNPQQFQQLGASLGAMIGEINNAGSVDRATSSLVSAIARLANAGSKSEIVSAELPRLGSALTRLVRDMSQAPKAEQETVTLVSAISKLASAGQKAQQTATNLDYLGDRTLAFINKLSKAPQVSASTTQLMSAIGNIASAGNMANGALRNLSNGTKNVAIGGTSGILKFGRAFSLLKGRIGDARQSLSLFNRNGKGFVSAIGMFYAKMFLVIRGFKALGSSIKSAMDYIEEYNYFTVTTSKVGNQYKKDFEKYGYDSATAYANSYEKRLSELNSKLTGFNVDENGNLSSTGIKNLGLDLQEVMNLESRILNITNSVGMIGEASIQSSKAITMLAGDLSSLTNMDLDQVADNMISGMSGMSMAVKKYGMDITVANLKQTAMDLGIQKNISSMSQSEKMYLRLITMLDSSKIAWTDLARTVNQPANMMRRLSNTLKQCAQLLGGLFMPVIQAVLPCVVAFAEAVKDLLLWLTQLFGIEMDSDIMATPDYSGYEDLADTVDDVTDATNNAADAQNKYNKQLQGFDKLNNLSKSSTSSSSSTPSGSGTPNVSNVLNDKLIKAVEDYEKKWNKAFSNMTDDVTKLKKQIKTLFTTAWKTGNGTAIGKTFAKWLNKGIAYLNSHWVIADSALNRVEKMITSSINGFTYYFDWSGLGKAISNTLTTYLKTKKNFFKDIDWSALGNGIAKSLNAFIGNGKTGPIQEYFAGLGAKLKAAIEFAFSTVTTFDFKNFGKSIGNGINDFFKEMKTVDKKTGLNGWQKLGKTLTKSISGISDAIITALDTVDWSEVGQAIADAISNIDWGKVTWNLVDMVISLKNAIKKGVEGSVGNGTLAEIIVDVGIAGFVFKKLTKTSLATAIAGLFGKKIVTKIPEAEVAVGKWTSAGTKAEKLKLIAQAIVKGVGKVSVGVTKASVAVKNWVVSGAKMADVATAVKNVFKGTNAIIDIGKVGEVAGKIAVSVGSIGFPDPVSDEMVRELDQSFTANVWKPLCDKIPWLDSDSDLGVFQLNPVFNWMEKGWNFVAHLTTDESDDYENFESLWQEKNQKRIFDANVKMSGDYKSYADIQSAWNKGFDGNRSINLAIVMDKAKLESVKEKIRKLKEEKIRLQTEGDLKGANKIQEKINSLKKQKITIQTDIKISEATKKSWKALLESKNASKVFDSGAIAAMKQAIGYANGGMPKLGELFYANETNGLPEMVGRIGRKTAVANGDQIVTSVSSGVSDAVYNVMTPVLSSLVGAMNQMASANGGDYQLQAVNEGDLFKVVRAENTKYKKMYGKSALV